MRSIGTWLAALVFWIQAGTALGDPPEVVWPSWEHAKQLARDHVYFDRRVTFYCACAFVPRGNAGGADIDPSDCGFEPRANPVRAGRLEWEHVVPASRMAGHLACWTTGHPLCADAGRSCCERAGVDEEARRRLFDLHNLVPSIGEVNGDRLNHPYGIVDGEPREYGACDFEVGGSPKRAEPREAVRGHVARIWLYMDETYDLGLSPEQRAMFEEWAEDNPVRPWELERDKRIEELQGNRNPHVR